MLFPDWLAPRHQAPVPPRGTPFTAPIAPVSAAPTPPGTPAEHAAFAESLLRFPDDAMKAAITVFGATRGNEVYAAAATWADLPEVRAQMAALLEEHGEEAFLPSKATVAREIYELASKRSLPSDDRHKLYKLYLDAMGHIPKPGGNVTIDARTQSVMIVKDHGSADDWEARMVEQQKRLTDVASG